MVPVRIQQAFGAESRRLSEVVAGLDDAAFARPTRCDPWTVAELVYHVGMTMRRLPGMLAAPEPAGALCSHSATRCGVPPRSSTTSR